MDGTEERDEALADELYEDLCRAGQQDFAEDPDEIMRRMLAAAEGEAPKMRAKLPRLGITLICRALHGHEISRIRDRCTYRKKLGGGRSEEAVRDDEFHAGLIVKATTNFNWGDPELAKRYNTSTPEKTCERALYGGELATLAGDILELSGFDDESVERLKN